MVGIVGFSRDGVGYVVVVALAVCLVCSVLVASAATFLKPMQTVNAKADRRSNILEVAGLPSGPDVDVNQVFKDRIEARVVDLSTGDYATDMESAEFDQRRAASDPDTSIKIPRSQDIADIKQRSKYPFYGPKRLTDHSESLRGGSASPFLFGLASASLWLFVLRWRCYLSLALNFMSTLPRLCLSFDAEPASQRNSAIFVEFLTVDDSV